MRKTKVSQFSFLLAMVFFFGFTRIVQANQKCLTIVNPVRSRELWKDKSVQPLINQYQAVNNNGLKATWLIQPDALYDIKLIDEIKKFNQSQEIGLFLEVSQDLATKSRVYYPTETPWYSPSAVFLSAYSLKDRKKIIDKMVLDFQNIFGYLPKSAGAWWIDSWSQQYLENKYQIKNMMIVADQKTTDNYGVWGQWWGYPYFPSTKNILVPGSSKTVVIQWALRDLEKAYFGNGPLFSNFSLQANDYLSQGLDINYFQKLANDYLSVKPLGQITVGLETGMESIGNEHEYVKQLQWLKDNQVDSYTMSEFGDKYRQVYGYKNPKKIILGNWILTQEYRENAFLSEKTTYQPDISFIDSFSYDKEPFLNRILPPKPEKKITFYLPLFLLIIPLLFLHSKSIIPVLFIIFLYLPVFRSYYSSGWKIFFGPQINSLILVQVLILIIGSFLVKKISKIFKIDQISWLSIWFINLLFLTFRYSIIEGKYYFGWLLDSYRFVGLSVAPGIKFINQDLVGYIAATMLKFKTEWIWGYWWSWLVVYPVFEVVLVLFFNKFFSKKLRYFFAFLSIFYFIYIFNLGPTLVK